MILACVTVAFGFFGLAIAAFGAGDQGSRAVMLVYAGMAITKGITRIEETSW